MTTINLPLISDCAEADCSFNHDGCHAPAVTVGDTNCLTFLPLTLRGGIDDAHAEVGACKSANCKHNENLVCHASAVKIGADGAECLTFSAR